MGNLFSAPRPRSRFEIPLDRSDSELVREALREMTDEARANAQFTRLRYERRQQRYATGRRSNSQHAPERPIFDPQEAFIPGPPPDQPTYPPGPPNGYGNYRPYQTGPGGDNLDEDDLEGGGPDDGSSPRRRNGNSWPQSRPRYADRGRTRQMPMGPVPRRQKPQQSPNGAFMSGALAEDGPEE
ncbi:MAG: hypothetical protein LQ338_000293 [Usnochroma carphineum]|nr:MAG: hypothetical protein LQ338_000293 [Usnochroma carphineum]